MTKSRKKRRMKEEKTSYSFICYEHYQGQKRKENLIISISKFVTEESKGYGVQVSNLIEKKRKGKRVWNSGLIVIFR